MPKLTSLFEGLTGYRTYLTSAGALLMSAATILTALATAAGVLCPQTGIVTGATFAALAAKCLALANIAQRLATTNSTDEVLAAIDELREVLPGGAPPPDPVVLDFFEDRPPAGGDHQPLGASPRFDSAELWDSAQRLMSAVQHEWSRAPQLKWGP